MPAGFTNPQLVDVGKAVIEKIKSRQCTIPRHMKEPFIAYIEYGVTGDHSFLRAVLENDFVEMCLRGDATNQDALLDWGVFFYNHMPMRTYGIIWGSKEVVNQWCKLGGIRGLASNG